MNEMGLLCLGEGGCGFEVKLGGDDKCGVGERNSDAAVGRRALVSSESGERYVDVGVDMFRYCR